MSEEFSETVYEHVSGRDTFTVTAAERWSKSMINRLKTKHPNEVDICCTNPDGSMVVHLPISWMKIKPKYKRNMTDEYRAKLSERFSKKLPLDMEENNADSEN